MLLVGCRGTHGRSEELRPSSAAIRATCGRKHNDPTKTHLKPTRANKTCKYARFPTLSPHNTTYSYICRSSNSPSPILLYRYSSALPLCMSLSRCIVTSKTCSNTDSCFAPFVFSRSRLCLRFLCCCSQCATCSYTPLLYPRLALAAKNPHNP